MVATQDAKMSKAMQKIHKAAYAADKGNLLEASRILTETATMAREQRDWYGLCEAIFFQSELLKISNKEGEAITLLEEILTLDSFDFADQIMKAKQVISEIKSK